MNPTHFIKIIFKFDSITRILPHAIIYSLLIVYYISMNNISTLYDINLICFIVAFIGFIIICSFISRKRANEVQEKMYTNLKSKPTTIIQRFSDETIDYTTKCYYHKKINKLFSLKLPERKENETLNSDKQYEAATARLISIANNNIDKFYLVHNELIIYNFYKNLYAMKYLYIISYFICFCYELYKNNSFTLPPFNDFDLLLKINSFWSIVFLLICFLIMIVLNSRMLKYCAFNYAKSLIKSCELMS